MRSFVAEGARWQARVDDGALDNPHSSRRVGWETIILDCLTDGRPQRIVYRPAGWLDVAHDAELAAAVREGQWIRARWGAPAAQRTPALSTPSARD